MTDLSENKMPRTTFDPENRVATTTQYPRLKLEKGERKRIVVIEKTPFYEFVHRLEMPKIGPNGQAIMETRESTRTPGDTWETNAMDFLSQALCLGDEAVLKERGVDEENCPACRVARNAPTEVAMPARKYVSHVLVYGTKPNSFEISEPFTVSCLPWMYSEKRFNALIDLEQEHDIQLRERDLLLGPCKNKNFQTYDIQIGGKCEWQMSEERQQMAKTAFVENRLDDDKLTEMIGRRVERSWLQEDLDKIHERWKRLEMGTPPTVSIEEQGETASLAEGLEGLLDESKDAKDIGEAIGAEPGLGDEKPQKGLEPVDFDDIIGEFK